VGLPPGYIYSIYIERKRERERTGIAVDTATSHELDGQRSIPSRGKRFFSSPQRLERLWDPPSLLYNVYRGLGVNRPGHEADHSPPTIAEVKLCLHFPIYIYIFIYLFI
jgi:hypothetical protein